MRTSFLLLIIIICFLNRAGAQEPRTRNFPSKRATVGQLPAKKNLWVVILAGQSNMAGRGQVSPADTLPHPRILALGAEMKWLQAKEPLHFYEPENTGLDCGMSFAREVIGSVGDSVSIALVPCAVGGSELRHWLGDSLHRDVSLLSNFEQRTEFARASGTIKALLWQQGESDAVPRVNRDYENQLRGLFEQFRKISGNEALPILVSELGRTSKPQLMQDKMDTINIFINHLADSDDNIYRTETNGFSFKADSVHFDATSQRLMGKRFARTFIDKIIRESASRK